MNTTNPETSARTVRLRTLSERAKQRDQPSLRAEQVGEVVSAEVVFGETEGQPHELAQTRAG